MPNAAGAAATVLDRGEPRLSSDRQFISMVGEILDPASICV